jgi:hypothetical protein
LCEEAKLSLRLRVSAGKRFNFPARARPVFAPAHARGQEIGVEQGCVTIAPRRSFLEQRPSDG